MSRAKCKRPKPRANPPGSGPKLVPAKRRRRSTPGPKPSITLEVVKRVSTRVGQGLTLALALAAENVPTVNEETWKKALQAHPEFSPHYESGKGKFLAESIERLAYSGELKFLCWLLERRHSDLFARPAGVAVSVEANAIAGAEANAAVGIPADVVQRSREIAAAEQPKVSSLKPKARTHGE